MYTKKARFTGSPVDFAAIVRSWEAEREDEHRVRVFDLWLKEPERAVARVHTMDEIPHIPPTEREIVEALREGEDWLIRADMAGSAIAEIEALRTPQGSMLTLRCSSEKTYYWAPAEHWWNVLLDYLRVLGWKVDKLDEPTSLQALDSLTKAEGANPAFACSIPEPSRPTIFISYSHKDEAWKDRLVIQLKVLQKLGLLDLWDDRRSAGGDDWHPAIQAAMERAAVAVLLISANYLTSDFILNEEVPRLLQRREHEGLRVIPVIVGPCPWQKVSWLSSILARPRDGRPLSSVTEAQAEKDLADLAEEIADILKGAGDAGKNAVRSG